MPALVEVREKISGFLVGEMKLSPEAFHFIRITKQDEGWEGVIELTEKNEYLVKMGYPTIFDKKQYKVSLDGELNVVGYEREEEFG